MIYRCKIFDSKIPDIVFIYALLYPSILNWKGYVDLKHQLYNFFTKSQTHKCALGLVLLVISIINNLCPKIMTQYLCYQLDKWHVLKRTLVFVMHYALNRENVSIAFDVFVTLLWANMRILR